MTPIPFKKVRTAANGLLAQLSRTYHRDIPLGTIEAGLLLLDLRMADEGGFILCGRDGHTTVPLTFHGAPVPAVLSLSWHRMDGSGSYEITAYVS